MAEALSESLRRVPQQARAQRRVERLLDAAELEFVETGYQAATTNQIAARAGTSIGSLYDFFGNKQALASALARRYVDQLGELYDARIVNDPRSSGEVLIDSIVDALAAFWRRHPGVVPLLRGALGAPELVEAGETLRVAFVQHIEAVLDARRHHMPPERRRLVAEISVDIARTLLERVAAEPGHHRPAVLAETKTALLAYLRAALR